VTPQTGVVRILAISDVEDEAVAASLPDRAGTVDLVLGCGDLSYDYLDYVATSLGAPLRAVHGNHDVPPESMDDPEIKVWWEGIDLHGRIVSLNGLLVGGLEGSYRYNEGRYQSGEWDMWLAIVRMLPALVWNRIRRGRFLDVLVTHAPPRGIHDQTDLAHRGFAAFRTFLRWFAPRYHLHGHTHIYDSRTETTTRFGRTTVVNAFGARTIEL
jgi:Icc-related predicted phosphoesterase